MSAFTIGTIGSIGTIGKKAWVVLGALTLVAGAARAAEVTRVVSALDETTPSTST